MSLSPSNILAKLEELKKWQQKQQERLLDQHQRRLQYNEDNSLAEAIPTEQNDGEFLPKNVTTDRIPKAKLSKSHNGSDYNLENTGKKPKQPFLRRGTGLTRFRMTPGEQFKPFPKVINKSGQNNFSKTKRTHVTNKTTQKPDTKKINKKNTIINSKLKGNVKNTREKSSKEHLLVDSETNRQENVDDKLQNEKPIITPLKKPNLNIEPKAVWYPTSTAQEEIPQDNANLQIYESISERSNLMPSVLHNSFAVANNVKTWATNKSEEDQQKINVSDRDLLIFEALEQRAMQNSFCSTNSSIVRLLSSTPSKSSPIQNKTDTNTQENTHFHAVHVNQDKIDNNRVSKVNYEGYHEQLQTIPIAVEKNVELQNGLKVAQNSQTLHDIEAFEKRIQDDYLSLIEKALKFKQYVTRDGSSPSSSASSVLSEDVETTYENTIQADANFNDENKWIDDDTSNTLSSISSPNSTKIWDNQEIKCNAETMTDDNINSGTLLENKVEELEKELGVIRAESVKTSKLKEHLEKQQKQFEKYKKQIIKEAEEEKSKINNFLEEEKKKLAKERMVFERYVKDLQNKPSKKEREESSALKTELATLKETLKLKETKNGMAQARLRNQIKTLEKENAGLKAEIDNLNKQNAKLVANQKLNRKPSDTKMLHEINKNLTKLAQEKLGGQKNKPEKEPSFSTEERLERNEKFKSYDPGINISEREHSPPRRKTTQLTREKENDKNTINTGSEKNLSDVDLIEETYQQKFGIKSYGSLQRLSNGSFEENKRSDRTEETLSNGTKQIKYSNGNEKTISPDGNHIVLKYYNGDIKETNLLEGTVRYHYYESKVNHTTFADGTELIEFPDGQTERRLKDGVCEIYHPKGIVRRMSSDGTEKISYPDGTNVTINTQGERVLLLPNGQKEIHTSEHKRREYPDGTVKILYPDGLQETRYANGRIRLKDKHGKLLMDSQDCNVSNY